MKTSALLRALHQECGVVRAELCRRYPQYAQRSVYRHATATNDTSVVDRRHENKGRLRKLKQRQERIIILTLLRLRKRQASFSAKKIQEESGLMHVSTKSIYRVLHRHGYRYRQSRKKGLLSPNDIKRRLKFARQCRIHPVEFWTNTIKFYLDGVGFAHRMNPYSEARAASSMAWRKPGEGLSMTTKGKKEGSGGKMANFFVAISHGSGVVLCQHHDWQVTGKLFAEFVGEHFPGKNNLHFPLLICIFDRKPVKCQIIKHLFQIIKMKTHNVNNYLLF